MAENQHTIKGKKILPGMSEKLSIISEKKVVQKLSLEKNVLLKNGLLNW